MACPSAGSEFEREVQELRARGVGGVVSLTLSPLAQGVLSQAGMDYLHLPTADFGAPTQEQIGEFLRFADRVVSRGRAVVVHCMAGLGRTGTLLACWLVHEGRSADDAIRQVRSVRPGSIEADAQEEAVRSFALYLESEGGR